MTADAPDATDEFPIAPELCYLNHAAVGPLPRRSAAAVAAFCEEASRRPTVDYGRWLSAEARLRERLGRLLGDRHPEDVSLVANTSHAISIVAEGLPWQAGDSVVLPAHEFPSNALPWQQLARRGVTVRQVPLGTRGDPAPLLAAADRSTRLIAASWVRYDTGERLHLERLATACRARGILLLIDAIQGLGALRLPPVPIDFVAGGSHKWLLGPEGVGYLYCEPAARERLQLRLHGWRMLEAPFEFDRPGRAPAADARRFEPGTMNVMGIVGLEASLSLLETVGMARVERAVEERVAHLADAIAAVAPCHRVTPADPGARAGILAYRVERDDEGLARLLRALQERGVIVAVRGGLLRLSPHFHTPFSALDAAVDELAATLRQR